MFRFLLFLLVSILVFWGLIQCFCPTSLSSSFLSLLSATQRTVRHKLAQVAALHSLLSDRCEIERRSDKVFSGTSAKANNSPHTHTHSPQPQHTPSSLTPANGRLIKVIVLRPYFQSPPSLSHTTSRHTAFV